MVDNNSKTPWLADFETLMDHFFVEIVTSMTKNQPSKHKNRGVSQI